MPVIVDSHCHLGGPDKGDNAELSVEKILKIMEEAGVDKAIVFPFNDINAGISFRNANNFISEAVKKSKNKLIGFCRLDPNAGERAIEELERAFYELKLKGVKLHPKAQNFTPENRYVAKIIEKAAEFKLPVVFDSGKSIFPNKAIAKLAEKIPDAKIILAHMRGDGYIEACRENENIYLGTVKAGDLEKIKLALSELGAERIIAGSDTPYASMKYEMIEKFEALELSEREKELIRGKNILRLLRYKNA